MVFFMFALFVNNPAVSHGYMHETAKLLLQICRWITIFFAIFFILFFHAALIRSRKKEFGLFLILGMQRSQVARLLFYESILLGGAAILIGMGLGLLFGKLFLLAMSNLLDLSVAIPFIVSGKSIISTLLLFGLVFLLDGIIVSLRVSRYTPKSLLIGGRETQKPPRSSVMLAVLGVALIGSAYAMAIYMSEAFILNVIPIISFTIIGTYLVYRQLIVFVLQRLRRRPLKGRSLLIVSRMAYRIKDQTRMLTLITVLTAIVLTAMGAVYSSMKVLNVNALRENPFSLQVIANEGSDLPLSGWVEKEMKEWNLHIDYHVETPLLIGKFFKDGRDFDTWVIADSEFKKLVEVVRLAHPSIAQYLKPEESPEDGEAKLYVPHPVFMGEFAPSQQLKLEVNGTKRSYTIQGQNKTTRVINFSNIDPYTLLVVPDQEFESLNGEASSAERWRSYGFMIAEWKDSYPMINGIKEELLNYGLDEGKVYQSDTISSALGAQQLFSIMLFAGFFISILFILACGSTIYFKLFTQLDEDRRQFTALRRMGFNKKEVSKVLNIELLFLFFIPFLFALIHSYVAMIDYDNLVVNSISPGTNFWFAFYLVVFITFCSYFIYYLIARIRYVRQIWQ
jgi:ABC-type antimicrobial peptide transport system permease subunit